MTGWKTWRDKLLIPDQHEPGNQRGYMAGKQKKNVGSEHQSRANKNVTYWPLGRGASGQ